MSAAFVLGCETQDIVLRVIGDPAPFPTLEGPAKSIGEMNDFIAPV
jgi:hypothetical protein